VIKEEPMDGTVMGDNTIDDLPRKVHIKDEEEHLDLEAVLKKEMNPQDRVNDIGEVELKSEKDEGTTEVKGIFYPNDKTE
jgi:hypothetical protein